MEKLGLFFNDVMHRKFIPNPRPLTIRPPREENADHLLLFEDLLLDCIEDRQHIHGWPGFVMREFGTYSPDERLKAIALPLVMSDPPFSVRKRDQIFYGDLDAFTVTVEDFDIIWEGAHGH
jgi:hypothetical protein